MWPEIAVYIAPAGKLGSALLQNKLLIILFGALFGATVALFLSFRDIFLSDVGRIANHGIKRRDGHVSVLLFAQSCHFNVTWQYEKSLVCMDIEEVTACNLRIVLGVDEIASRQVCCRQVGGKIRDVYAE